MCRQVNLHGDDMDNMTVGMCLDYMEEFIEQQNPNHKRKKKERKATQADFDAF